MGGQGAWGWGGYTSAVRAVLSRRRGECTYGAAAQTVHARNGLADARPAGAAAPNSRAGAGTRCVSSGPGRVGQRRRGGQGGGCELRSGFCRLRWDAGVARGGKGGGGCERRARVAAAVCAGPHTPNPRCDRPRELWGGGVVHHRWLERAVRVCLRRRQRELCRAFIGPWADGSGGGGRRLVCTYLARTVAADVAKD